MELLTELAGVLLKAGVSASEFERAAKIGFVAAASRVARLRNSRVNKSAVAAMTGLSRAEVKRLSECGIADSVDQKCRQRALRVLDGWRSDPDYLDSRGLPRPLPLQLKGMGFADLVRRYSGDIPPRAILRELMRLDLVMQEGNQISVRQVDPDRHALQQLQTLVAVFGPMLSDISTSRKVPVKLLTRSITLGVPDSKAQKLLHKQVHEAVRSFFVSLQAAAEGASLPRREKSATPRSTRVCVLISE